MYNKYKYRNILLMDSINHMLLFITFKTLSISSSSKYGCIGKLNILDPKSSETGKSPFLYFNFFLFDF